jgi:uncharacterized membrane protein YecN with MAPEG domain
MPGWLIVICGVLVQPARVRRADSARKDGKSHRALVFAAFLAAAMIVGVAPGSLVAQPIAS